MVIPGRKWRIKQAPSTNQDQIFWIVKGKTAWIHPVSQWSWVQERFPPTIFHIILIYHDLELPPAQDASGK